MLVSQNYLILDWYPAPHWFVGAVSSQHDRRRRRHPRFQKTRFKVGQVLTVEAGLYYPDLGGTRTEDVVAITQRGIRMLSHCENRLET